MDMGDIFGDIFGDFFGGGRRNSNNNGPAQGASVRLTVRITFEEAVFGCSKELEFPYKEECKTCHGKIAYPLIESFLLLHMFFLCCMFNMFNVVPHEDA